MNYYNKYLKYKIKYNKLKSLLGYGDNNSSDTKPSTKLKRVGAIKYRLNQTAVPTPTVPTPTVPTPTIPTPTVPTPTVPTPTVPTPTVPTPTVPTPTIPTPTVPTSTVPTPTEPTPAVEAEADEDEDEADEDEDEDEAEADEDEDEDESDEDEDEDGADADGAEPKRDAIKKTFDEEQEYNQFIDKINRFLSLSLEEQENIYNQYLTKEQSESSVGYRQSSVQQSELQVIGTSGITEEDSTLEQQLEKPKKLGMARFIKRKSEINVFEQLSQQLIQNHIPNDDTQLLDCYIASSHNTYLQGNQISGKVNVDCYINFIKYFKGGCIEFDPLHIAKRKTSDNVLFDVTIGHHKTPTGVLYLSDILFGIKQLLDNPEFEINNPIIFSFDNKDIKSYNDHQIIWFILLLYLGNHLYLNFDDNEFKLKDINKKILIKWKQCNKPECKTNNIKCNCLPMIKPSPDKLITDKFWTHMNDKNTKSYETTKIPNFTRNLSEIIKFKEENSIKIKLSNTQEIYNYIPKFIRTYPRGANIKSGNYPFLHKILYGVNMVALNMQKQDKHTMLMIEFFRDGCIRLKPLWYYNLELETIPTSNYDIYFNNLFTNIKVCDETEIEKKCIKAKKAINNTHMISIEVTKEIEIIYLKLKYKDKYWHGGITLYRPDNYLYLYTNKGLNCNWLMELTEKIEININIKKILPDKKIIEIIPLN